MPRSNRKPFFVFGRRVHFILWGPGRSLKPRFYRWSDTALRSIYAFSIDLGFLEMRVWHREETLPHGHRDTQTQ